MLVPMLTINKMTAALIAILSCANNKHTEAQANLDLIWVIANETIKEVELRLSKSRQRQWQATNGSHERIILSYMGAGGDAWPLLEWNLVTHPPFMTDDRF
jgi:hypothetical protein